MRFSGNKGKLKEDDKFQLQTCTNQQTEDCPGI